MYENRVDLSQLCCAYLNFYERIFIYMNDIYMLSAMKVGERAKVCSLNSESSLYRRLCDIGLVEGTEIDCVMRSPLGDPCAYRVRGAVVALRKCDTCDIMVCR